MGEHPGSFRSLPEICEEDPQRQEHWVPSSVWVKL